MRPSRILIADDGAPWTSLAGETIADAIARAIAARGGASIALCGGETPRPVYEWLSGAPRRDDSDWRRVEFFWSDERAVAPDDPASNFRMAREALLSRLPATGPVHRIRGEEGANAAARYERELAGLVRDRDGVPRLDVILLGIGEDGHTASLFPTTVSLEDDSRLVVPTVAPAPPRTRISFTLRTIDAARCVIFLVSGERKAEAVSRVLGAGRDPRGRPMPAACVAPRDGENVLVLDRAAARRISETANAVPPMAHTGGAHGL